jgi:hypothetical protein
MVVLLELDCGREGASADSSLLRLVGRSILDNEPNPDMALARLLRVELCLLRVGGVCVLHLLLTLSLRFMLALSTKPPMPLVGDTGRSRSGEILPCIDDMSGPRVSPALSPLSPVVPCSDGGANFCDSSVGRGDRVAAASVSPPETEVAAEKRLLMAVLPRIEPPLDVGRLEGALSVGGLASSGSLLDAVDSRETVESRDMPGNCLLPMDPVSDAVSSSFFLYAAAPLPLSADWRKYAGSFAPKDAAIWVLESGRSGEDGVDAPRELGRAATDRGRRVLPDCGRCFHERVPERPNAAALVAGFCGSLSSVEGAEGPVNCCSDSSRAAASSCVGGGLMVAGFSCVCRGVVGFSGEIERARSALGEALVRWSQQQKKWAGAHTCSARESFAPSLNQLLFQLSVSNRLFSELPDAPCELLWVDFLRHDLGPLVNSKRPRVNTLETEFPMRPCFKTATRRE